MREYTEKQQAWLDYANAKAKDKKEKWLIYLAVRDKRPRQYYIELEGMRERIKSVDNYKLPVQ